MNDKQDMVLLDLVKRILDIIEKHTKLINILHYAIYVAFAVGIMGWFL